MALTSTPADLQDKLKKRLKTPFDPQERNDILGNNEALNHQLSVLSGSLNAFDPGRERDSRVRLLDDQAQQSRENIARTFALDPSGIQTGAAIRPFSAIEGARLQNLAALEHELSTRAGAENRANLGSLAALQGQQQNANLAASGLSLNALQALQQQLQFDRSQDLAEQSERGRQVGLFALPGESDRDTLAKKQLGQQQSQFEASLGEQQAARADANKLRETEITGKGVRELAPGVFETFDTLAAQEMNRRLGLSESELFGGAVLRDGQGNPVLDDEGQPILRDTLAARQLTQQGQLAGRQLGLQESELFGGTLLTDAQGNPVMDNEGNPIQRNTAQAQQFEQRMALERLGLTGTESGTETIALQQLRQQDDQFDAQLSQRASEFARQFGLSEAELFGGGPSVTFTAQELSTLRMGAKQGDQDFRPEMDVNGNGVYEFADFIKLSSGSADIGNGIRQYIPDEGKRTLAQKQLDIASREAAQSLGIEQSRLDEATRQFDAQFGQAQAEFQTMTSGFVFDDDGNIKHTWGLNSFGLPVPVPVTTLERDQFNEQKRQFNEKLGFDVQALADKLGVDLKKVDATRFAAMMELVGSIANAAGTVVGDKLTSSRTNLSTLPGGGGPSLGLSFGTGGLQIG